MTNSNPTSTPAEPRPKRRWFRFGLRALLVVMVVVACAAGWVASHVDRARKEEQAIAELKAIHGTSLNLLFANPFRDDDGAGEMEMFFEGGPAWLKNILGVDIGRTVVGMTCYAPGNSFHYDGVDEKGEFYIRRDYKTGVFDEQLAMVSRLTNLEFLAMEASPVGDSGAAYLANLRKLKSLNMSRTAIGDQAVETIARLPNLETLNISRTEVSDLALVQLEKCRSLQTLNVEITKVTDEGIARLQNSLPNCEIEH